MSNLPISIECFFSMTLPFGAAQNPVGVATGATAGHFLATLIAVVGGSLLSKRISAGWSVYSL